MIFLHNTQTFDNEKHEFILFYAYKEFHLFDASSMFESAIEYL